LWLLRLFGVQQRQHRRQSRLNPRVHVVTLAAGRACQRGTIRRFRHQMQAQFTPSRLQTFSIGRGLALRLMRRSKRIAAEQKWHALRGRVIVTFRYRSTWTRKEQRSLVWWRRKWPSVNLDLVVTDEQGKPFSVCYQEVNAMLLNEFLKEHRRVQELETGMED
jgi:hypothetical protein